MILWKFFYVLVNFSYYDALKKSCSPQIALLAKTMEVVVPPQIPVPWVKETVTMILTVLVI